MEQAMIVIDLGASENAHAFFPAHLQQYGFNRFELCKRNSLPRRFDLRGVSGEIDDLALAKTEIRKLRLDCWLCCVGQSLPNLLQAQYGYPKLSSSQTPSTPMTAAAYSRGVE